ncbi:MAG: hypothetical protein H0V29_09935 [Thermoleophilaceae bacterium]|nr:hypothetical protein [Thermoleophilaceae bacterium]
MKIFIDTSTVVVKVPFSPEGLAATRALSDDGIPRRHRRPPAAGTCGGPRAAHSPLD